MDKITFAIVQAIITSALTSGIFYFVQRKHKRNDSFINEKNKAIVQKCIDSEVELFAIFKTVKSQFNIDRADLITYSNQITQKRLDNHLYISEKISEISRKFSDYLLEVAGDESSRSKFEEDRLIEKFKREFKK